MAVSAVQAVTSRTDEVRPEEPQCVEKRAYQLLLLGVHEPLVGASRRMAHISTLQQSKETERAVGEFTHTHTHTFHSITMQHTRQTQRNTISSMAVCGRNQTLRRRVRLKRNDDRF